MSQEPAVTGDLLTRRLSHFARLSTADKRAVAVLSSDRVHSVGAREDLARERDAPSGVKVILSGWACRYKLIEDGRRQIIAFLIPGDACDLDVLLLREMDHSIGSITAVMFADVARQTIAPIMTDFPRVAQALLWSQQVTHAVQREWTFNVGRRTAAERVGHLLCELFIRMRVVGLTHDSACELPLTQADLADATGLSAVHANRTLQELRAQTLIVLRGKELKIPDLAALQASVGFNENYLHLDREGRSLDALEA